MQQIFILVAPFNDIPDWNNEEFRIPKKIKFKKVKRKPKRKPIKTTQRPRVETTTTTTTTTTGKKHALKNRTSSSKIINFTKKMILVYQLGSRTVIYTQLYISLRVWACVWMMRARAQVWLSVQTRVWLRVLPCVWSHVQPHIFFPNECPGLC